MSARLRRALLWIDEQKGALAYGRAALTAAFMRDSFYMALPRVRVFNVGGIAIERPRAFLHPGLFFRQHPTLNEMSADIAIPRRVIGALLADMP